MSHRDPNIDWTMPNVELVRAIFIYNKMFNFQLNSTIIFGVIVYTGTQTERKRGRLTDTTTARQTERHEDTQTDMNTATIIRGSHT